jgi:hypothetical protein
MNSLEDLRSERRVREVALAESQGLSIETITGWGPGEIDPIEVDLLECSTGYSEAAVDLRDTLEAMTAEDLSDWFDSIQWEPVGSRMVDRIADYMKRG